MRTIRGGLLLLALASAAAQTAPGWRSEFTVDRKSLGPAGGSVANPHFVLLPGYRLHYSDGAAGGVRSTMIVLKETRIVDGVETTVVEDREERNGVPQEVTRDYYAVDRTTGDVYYFGEEVDVYKRGKVASHEGTWMSGVHGARFGLMMPGPGRIALRDRFYQERAPADRAVDRSEIVALADTVETPAGRFAKCVHMHDTSAVEKGPGDHKWYAPGVGLVKDGAMVLVKIERP